MINVTFRPVLGMILLLCVAFLAPALEPFDTFGEPLLVTGIDRLVIDSLADFDVEIRGRDTGVLRMEVISSRRRSEEIFYDERGSTFLVDQERRRSLWRFLPRRLLITVPKGTDVEVTTVTGDIRIDGLSDGAVLSSSSGDVSVSRSQGLVNISTATGDVELDGGIGPTVVRSSSGSVRLGNRRGRFVVETAAGDIRVSNGLLEESSSFLSSAGDIDLRLRNPRREVRGVLEAGRGDLQLDGAVLDSPVEDSQGDYLLLARTASGSLRIVTGR